MCCLLAFLPPDVATDWVPGRSGSSGPLAHCDAEFLFCLCLLTRQVQFFSCYGSFGCLLSGSMYSRKNCPPESAFHFWNGGSRIRCSHGGNLHAVNRPLRGASVNLGCFFLRPGTHGSKLTPLPGLCQPWLFFFGRRSGGRIWRLAKLKLLNRMRSACNATLFVVAVLHLSQYHSPEV